jgi:transcriptional regulator with XRE-family HTH domain
MMIVDIETQRIRHKISMTRLCAASGVSERNYCRIRSGEQQARPETISRLAAGLAASRRGERTTPADMQFRLVCGMLAYDRDIDVARVLSHDPQLKATSDPKWSEVQQLRDIAIYVLRTVLGTSGVEVARVAKVSEAAVSFALGRMELRRDDPVLDRMFSALEQAVQG